ncbi:MAG: dual specificity protein phosphatase family protein [Anaerolineales bacterium]|nr:dual specificity protein phosphatase family protein [Anaerolineales bacterium]
MTWATDDIFVAGGDYVSANWAEFQAQAGVNAVVTLSTDGPPTYGEPRPWAALCLPVADEAAWTPAHLSLGVAFIDAALAAGHKVLLHAPAGLHRTRPLVAAHLLARGRSLARVLRDLEAKPWLPPYKGSREVLEQWGAQLPGKAKPPALKIRDSGDAGASGDFGPMPE